MNYKLFMKENNLTEIENIKIRKIWNVELSEFQFSVIDAIKNLNLSTDPRNYWKVLKNRLKKEHPELVTNCNQLKMASIDGKNYLTDVATAPTILKIIQLISPTKVVTFGQFFDHLEQQNRRDKIISEDEGEKISTDCFEEGEIQVDMSQNGENYILVKAMIAGVNPSDIFISVNYKTLIIKSKRIKPNSIEDENYKYQELFWGKSKRIIALPYEVDIDKVQAFEKHGLLTIKLFILDKEQTRIIKVKSI